MSGFEIPLLIAGTATAGYSAYQQGQTAKQQAKAEAAWHAYNAKQAEKEAEAERKASEQEAIQQKRQGEQIEARHRALRGASGVGKKGSPLLDLENDAAEWALEMANVSEIGARRVSFQKSQAILDFSKASAVSKSASGYAKAGALKAGSSLLQGASGAAFMYSKGSPLWPGGPKKKI